jgi:hypothetical protein
VLSLLISSSQWGGRGKGREITFAWKQAVSIHFSKEKGKQNKTIKIKIKLF